VQLAQAARAVGRINIVGHPQLQWVGTGWLVDDATVVTNRHVAREFGRRAGGKFIFAGFGGAPVSTSIDFLQEVDRSDTREFQIVDILHIEDDDGPDMALLRVEAGPDGPGLAQPIPLDGAGASAGQLVAVIGYPARDSRIPDFALMQSIFGDVYDRKRLAPGQVIEARPDLITHDCSTLGGSSGSVVLDLAGGHAIALHFAGRFLKANSAVPVSVIAERLAALKRPADPHGIGLSPGGPGGPGVQPGGPGPSPGAADVPGVDGGESGEEFIEGTPADYVGRTGYDPEFLDVAVPLPEVTNAADVVAFQGPLGLEHTLHYEHFSVVMSRSRRMCIFSAANLDGALVRRAKRTAWRIDPRIPSALQIRNECYGNAPRFSRGHMTRRTDPVWGEPASAAMANADSMHVTNTVPQVQPFNAGIWLGLEDYALDHAVEDDMRISVLTGPFLLADDPVRFGVRVPRSFWKVIAFVHDDTRELAATGYVMSQEDLLGDQEFVFGQHKTWQVAIGAIERRAGLSFPGLAEADPLVDADEGLATPLTDFRQIRFGRG
jgi:endonuclease G